MGDGEQAALGESQTLTALGVETVVLLRGGDGNDGVVAIVAAAEKDADQRLVAGGLRRGEGIHLAEAGEHAHGAERADGANRVANELSS